MIKVVLPLEKCTSNAQRCPEIKNNRDSYQSPEIFGNLSTPRRGGKIHQIIIGTVLRVSYATKSFGNVINFFNLRLPIMFVYAKELHAVTWK